MKRLIATVSALMLAGTLTAGAQPGTWSPTPVPVDHGDITTIAALNDHEAFAFGYRLTGLQQVEQVALRWDGTAWTQHSLLPPNTFAAASDVRSASDIWIAGSATAHWDGTTWTTRQLGQSPRGRMVPDAIASTTSGRRWVAGRQMRMSVKDALPAIQSWNGTAWQDDTLPDLGAGELTGLAVAGENDIWAAGSQFVDGGAQRPLALRWDGTSWQQVETPTLPGKSAWLTGISAFGRDDVWAVGGSYSDHGDVPFAMHWDGRKWTVTRTPLVWDGRLRAVGRTGAGEVWAVGGRGGVSVALRWESRLRTWVRVAAPDVVVRGFSSVPGGSGLWTAGVARQGDLVPTVNRR